MTFAFRHPQIHACDALLHDLVLQQLLCKVSSWMLEQSRLEKTVLWGGGERGEREEGEGNEAKP